MELWIRSQNKYSLIKAYDLQIDSYNYKKDKVLIVNSRTSADCVILGEYQTEARALEVLDEINQQIEYLYNLKYDIGIDVCEKITYQMPKE